MATSPEQMTAAIRRNLPAKTGRTMEEWVEAAHAQGLADRKAIVAWLKAEHGIGTVTAEHIAWEVVRPADHREATVEELLAAQFAAQKAALLPIYEKLVEAARALGPDVLVEPRQTYVSLSRKVQFGVIQASTRSRVDLGLRLDGVEPHGRLLDAGSFGSGNVTHRIAFASEDDIDAEVAGWLRAAYDRAGKGRQGQRT